MNNKYSLPKDGGLIEVSAPRDIIHLSLIHISEPTRRS